MGRPLLLRPTVPGMPTKMSQDISQDREAWDTALAQTITEAVAREMAKAHVHYQAILNERGAGTLQTSLKVSS